MGFKGYRIQLVARLILLVVNSAGLALSLPLQGYWLLKINLILLLIVQIYSHFRFLTRWQRDLAIFTTSVAFNDYSIVFRKSKDDDAFPEIYNLLNAVSDYARKVKSEYVQQHQYFGNIIENAQVGILAYDENGSIILCNKTALEYAGASDLKQLHQLKELNRELFEQIQQLRSGLPRLLTLKKGQVQKISGRLSKLSIDQKTVYLLSLLNINPELEENELRSWQELINVLTHEIMNSVTPIHSLSGSMQKYLDRIEGNEETVMKARSSLELIARRSAALMDFVNRYREVSNVPVPRFQETDAGELVSSVISLLENDLRNIDVFVNHNHERIFLDPAQIEQVLINLVRNAVIAMDNAPVKKLSVVIWEDEGSHHIRISDTGSGIPAELLDQIFIPFFTTRKGGSGIGLTISKQIMHRHGGHLRVTSQPGRGSSFVLVFHKSYQTQNNFL